MHAIVKKINNARAHAGLTCAIFIIDEVAQLRRIFVTFAVFTSTAHGCITVLVLFLVNVIFNIAVFIVQEPCSLVVRGTLKGKN